MPRFGLSRHYQIARTSDISRSRCYSARIMQDRASQAHRLRRLRAISFDGDMTLWDFDAVMRHSLSYTLTELQAHLPANLLVDLTIDRMIEIRDVVAEGLRS